MTPAEFEEASYEAPLYNQLERGVTNLYTPGKVLEAQLGFDRGILIAEHLVWETLGYAAPPPGIALGYYDWPVFAALRLPDRPLPRFRLNVFLQAKRSGYYKRRPRALQKFADYRGPLWAFSTTMHQQELLERLATRAGRRAHVTYAAPAFHTRGELYKHTRLRTLVQNSTFPSALALKGHESWYYKEPGATGIANPNPERIGGHGFLEVIAALAADAPETEPGDYSGYAQIAQDVIAAVQDTGDLEDPGVAKFMDDLQTLDRLLDRYLFRSPWRDYAQVRLFSEEFDLTWFIYGDLRERKRE
jgi:hypothetical protein